MLNAKGKLIVSRFTFHVSNPATHVSYRASKNYLPITLIKAS